jgi:hypothetical protein
VLLNIAISVVLSVILNATKVPAGTDETLPHQYTADPEPESAPVPAGIGATAAGPAGAAPAAGD